MSCVIVLEITHNDTAWGETIGVVGNSTELGSWTRPIPLVSEDFPLWRVVLPNLQPGLTYEYKYVVLADAQSRIARWEDLGPNMRNRSFLAVHGIRVNDGTWGVPRRSAPGTPWADNESNCDEAVRETSSNKSGNLEERTQEREEGCHDALVNGRNDARDMRGTKRRMCDDGEHDVASTTASEVSWQSAQLGHRLSSSRGTGRSGETGSTRDDGARQYAEEQVYPTSTLRNERGRNLDEAVVDRWSLDEVAMWLRTELSVVSVDLETTRRRLRAVRIERSGSHGARVDPKVTEEAMFDDLSDREQEDVSCDEALQLARDAMQDTTLSLDTVRMGLRKARVVSGRESHSKRSARQWMLLVICVMLSFRVVTTLVNRAARPAF